MAQLKVPYLNLSGPDGQQVRRNFEEIHKFFSGMTSTTSSSGEVKYLYEGGVELYHPASTPYIDFHQAASPAGDSNADFNVRIINDAANRLRLSTATGVDTNTGGVFYAGNGWIGSHPVHGGNGWTNFGHTARTASGDYQYMANSSGELLMNASGTNKIIRFFIDGATQLLHMNTTRSWFPGKIVAGPSDITDFEPISTNGSASGISFNNRDGGHPRWVIYPNANGLNFWDGANRFLMEDDDGRARFQCGIGWGGAAIIGPWVGSDAYTAFANLSGAQANGSHYGMLMGQATGGDTRSYLSPSGNGTNNCILFRLAYNGSTGASFGNANETMNFNCTFDMAVPALGGGNTMNVQAGGSWQVGYISSSREHKLNIRTLRDTPDPDSGHQNPMFKVRPVRFNWKQDRQDSQKGWMLEGVANGDRMNELHPNGVSGLLAEEVALIVPDAAIWSEEIPSEPWDLVKHGLPPNDPDTGLPLTHTPGSTKRLMGIDNDRLIAYLIDAVQYLEEEVSRLRSKAVGLGPEDRKPIR